MEENIWSEDGADTAYQWYRKIASFEKLRIWANRLYFEGNTRKLLDKDFLDSLRNRAFYSRIWELKIIEYLLQTKLKLLPTNGSGPDFCVQLDDGRKIWIEAVTANPDKELRQMQSEAISSGGLYDFPEDEMVLRYASSLKTKGEKLKNKYIGNIIGANDICIIALAAVEIGGGLWSEWDLLVKTVMPAGNPVIHVPRNDGRFRREPILATNAHVPYIKKANGSIVHKHFLFPGKEFSYIDGVLFSELEDLHELMGSSRLISSENEPDKIFGLPHIIKNYSSKKKIPTVFTGFFFLHYFTKTGKLISLNEIKPK